MIDLRQIKPVIYAPYNYFTIADKIGAMGEWKNIKRNKTRKRLEY